VKSRDPVDSNSVNFLSVNRMASKDPHVSSKVIDEIAARIKAKKSHMSAEQRISPMPPSKESLGVFSRPSVEVFGVPSRLSTPIGDIMRHRYGSEGEREISARYAQYSEQMHQREKLKIKPTKASRGHSAPPPPKEENTELFKISKFKKIDSIIKKFKQNSRN
jgi:hypothetical protein